MLQTMRKCAFGVVAAAALFAVPGSAFSQSIEIGPGGVRLRGECEQLRRACENKDVLGERGEGNCRRYRETCEPATWGSGQRQLNCSWATWAPFNGSYGLLCKEKIS
jgi:hypothetical protein